MICTRLGRWHSTCWPTAWLACWLIPSIVSGQGPVVVRLPTPASTAEPVNNDSPMFVAQHWPRTSEVAAGTAMATDLRRVPPTHSSFFDQPMSPAESGWLTAADATSDRPALATSYFTSPEPTLDFNLEPEAPVEIDDPYTASARQRGFLQQIRWTNTYLAGGGGDGLGMYSSGLQGTVAFPFFTTDAPMLITPGFTAHFLDGPGTIDMPARLYDSYVEIRHIRWFTPTFATDLAVTPGYYGDYELDQGDSFRLTGRGLALIDISPSAKLIAGVAYLNRDNLKLLPVGGLIWNPTDITKFELILPQPRIARRLNCCGPVEWWGYVAGEFGGGVWAIERQDGAGDRVTYNDLRFMFGIERKNAFGNSVRLEVGYVFDRELVYLNGTKVDLNDTAMARAYWPTDREGPSISASGCIDESPWRAPASPSSVRTVPRHLWPESEFEDTFSNGPRPMSPKFVASDVERRATP